MAWGLSWRTQPRAMDPEPGGYGTSLHSRLPKLALPLVAGPPQAGSLFMFTSWALHGESGPPCLLDATALFLAQFMTVGSSQKVDQLCRVPCMLCMVTPVQPLHGSRRLLGMNRKVGVKALRQRYGMGNWQSKYPVPVVSSPVLALYMDKPRALV